MNMNRTRLAVDREKPGNWKLKSFVVIQCLKVVEILVKIILIHERHLNIWKENGRKI